MRVSDEHRQFVASNAQERRTKVLREQLMEMGLNKAQANSCVKNQRKKLGLYKKASVKTEMEIIEETKKPKKKSKAI